MLQKINKYNFDKGLQGFSFHIPDTPFTAINISIGAGSRYESFNEVEMAHFLEHCMFSGTKKRPNNKVIGFEVESIGGSMNATTRSEVTSYYLKVPYENTKKAFEILSDMILNSTFENQYIELEKNIVIEELKMYKDNPQYRAWNLLDELIFKDTIMGVSLDTEIKETMTIDRSKVLSFIQNHYFANNTVISIVGNISSFNIEHMINKFYVPQNINEGKANFSKIKFNNKDRVLLFNMGAVQSTIILGMRSVGWKDDRLYTISVISAILGGGFGSKLFQILRNKKGLVYYINSENIPFIDGGLFTISTGTDNKNFTKVIVEIIKVLKDFKNGNFNDLDIKRAKEYIKSGMGETYETVESIAYSLSSQILLQGRILTLEEKKDRIDSVSKDEILNVFNDLFKDLYIAAVSSFNKNDIILDIISDVY